MRVYKPIGSKDRLVEIFQKVNKVKLNEGLYEAGSPNLNADAALNMAYNQLKNNKLDVENTNTETTGDGSYVVLTCIDKQGNNITFTFKMSSSEGDQEGVYNISNTTLEEFSFDSADGEDTIELKEEGLSNFNGQYGRELFDVIKKYSNVEEPAVQEAIDLIDAIKQDSYPFGGSPDGMQTGSGYADQKPTNDAVRVKAPELDQFIQEDMTMPTKIRTVDELKAYREQLKTQGFKGLRKEDIPLLADEALYEMAVKLADRMLPMGWDGLADVNSMWDYIRRNGGMTFEQLVKAVKRAVNVRLKEEGYSLKSLGLGETEDIQELDKPAMRLIQQAPGGATAGGVKQLEEKMTKPIVGGVSASISEDLIGEPKPINPSTKSPVDDLPPEKKKIIMDAINSLTKHKPDFAPSADQINTEILRLRNQPPAVGESGELEDTDVELKRFYKEKELASQHPEQISATAELEPEPEIELSSEDIKLIYQAEENLIAKNSRNPNYSPTTDEIRAEMDSIKGIKKPMKKFRGASKEGEFYLSEISNVSTADIAKKGTEQIFDKIDPNSNVKQQIIQAANEFLDMHLGVKRLQIPPEEYKRMLKEVALTMYVDYMGYTRQNEGLNEDAEKGDYPDPLGKKFKPKKHYPKKKKKLDTTVKLSEEIYSDDDIETPDLPIDTAVRRARGAERQATSDTNKEYGRQIDPNIQFQPELAEDEAKTGEKELEENYEDLRTYDTFVNLSDAYISLLDLSNEFRNDPNMQKALSLLRDAIANYCNMADMPNVTPEDVQNFFENTLREEVEYTDDDIANLPPAPSGYGGKVAAKKDMGKILEPVEEPLMEGDGMSLEPQGDEIEQLAQDKEEAGEVLQGGKGDGKSPLEFDPEQILIGLEVEKEHTDDPLTAIEVVMDHLTEDPEYYTQKDTPEASAQAGASADAGGEESTEEKPDVDDDKEMTDRLLGFKPHNVGDEVQEQEDVFGTLGNILNPKNTEFSPKKVIDDNKAKAIAKLAKVPAEVRAAVESGEYRKKYGLDTSGGSVWDFWRHNGFSDADAQLMSYIADKKISVDESTTVSDIGNRFQSVVNTPRPETPMIKEDNEEEIKERDPATWHQIQIAKKTLRMPGAMAGVMGGMSKEEAKEILRKRGIKFDDK